MSVQNTLGYNGFPIPIGTILPYAGVKFVDPPTGYLYCDGAEYAQVDYPELFEQLGFVYGLPIVTTNFFVPALFNSVVIGTDVNNDDNINGSATADYSVTLIEANIPSLPDAFFPVDLGVKPTYSAGVNGSNGITSSNITPAPNRGTIAPPAGAEFLDGNAQSTTAITVTYNTGSKIGLAYTNAAQPITVSLVVDDVVPKSVILKYIIKATY